MVGREPTPDDCDATAQLSRVSGPPMPAARRPRPLRENTGRSRQARQCGLEALPRLLARAPPAARPGLADRVPLAARPGRLRPGAREDLLGRARPAGRQWLPRLAPSLAWPPNVRLPWLPDAELQWLTDVVLRWLLADLPKGRATPGWPVRTRSASPSPRRPFDRPPGSEWGRVPAAGAPATARTARWGAP